MIVSKFQDSSNNWDEKVIIQTDSDSHSWNCNKTNPSPLVLNNGTVLLVLRTTSCLRDHDYAT